MPTFAFYLLKVVLCSAVLFGYYYFFLRNKVYHAYNRFYLLATVVIAILAPVINFNYLFMGSASPAKPIQLLRAVTSSDEYLEEVILYSHRNFISISQLLMLLYTIVSFVLLFALIKVIVQIVHLLKTNSSKYINDVVFVESNAKGTPFSFFKFIFWNSAIDLHSETGQQIFAHELAHVREKHSADKLFLNIVLIVCWINPIFWLIKKELNLIHEFIADKKAVANNDASALAAMIVTSAYPKHAYLLTNHFFYSPIKRRLQMLSKYNTTKAGYFYRILALPVVLFFVAAFTIKTKTGIEKIMNPENKITVVIDAGHGGSDGGAIAIDGTLEKDLNLDILKKIKALNKSSNINLVFTRETDVYQSPMEKAAFIKQSGADIFISLHVTTGPSKMQQTLSGLEIYVSNDDHENSRASKLFASSLIKHFKDNYELTVSPNPIQRKTSIAVLKASAIPSVIIETGYMNNPTDLNYIKSEKGKETIAQNILNAIAQYADNLKSEVYVAPILSSKKDTVPTAKNKMGLYKGEEIKKIEVSKDCEIVQLKLASGKTIYMSMNEAKKQHINLPQLKSSDQNTFTWDLNNDNKIIDASERLTITGEKISFHDNPKGNEKLIITGENIGFQVNANGNKNIQPLVLFDGKEIPYAEMNTINPDNIESVNVLKGEGAINKYGVEKSINGVIEITSKEKHTVNIQTPTINLSGITGPQIDIDHLKNIKEVNISMNDYSFESATVYFSGPGFKNVISVQLNNKSLQLLKQYLNRIEVGTTISFDNIMLLKNDGSKIEIGEKSFIFYDANQQEDVTVFNKLEQEATFPGGVAEWGQFLRKNLKAYMPVDEGWSAGTYTLIIKFIVAKDGSISDVIAENYKNSKTAQMCIDLIKNGPKWIPGRQNNRVVNSYRKQPITFVVQKQ
jgi:N-acetylmuramoyl-L-alanine amidase